MNAAVTLQPAGRRFDVMAGETVLDAALRAGIAVPYQCRSGGCGSCRAQLVDGRVEHRGDMNPAALGADDIAAGARLLCCAQADGEATLACALIDGIAGFALRRTTARVTGIERVADDIAVLCLELPEGQALQYRAGQYVQILLRDGRRRSYSLASAADAGGSRRIELHVRRRPGGAFTDHVFGKLKPREMLRIEGPFGTFCLDESSTKPLLLLATGTGYAPVAAIVEALIAAGLRRPVTLYRGGRDRADLYRHEQCEHWAASLPDFRYVPLLSGTPPDRWRGRRGRVPQAVCDDHADLSGHEVYACGSPAMIDAAQALLSARCGLPSSAFFADAFTAST
ncbi:MAG: CDP-6-deoxy-delta-3,4-glucoseen reductase [Solimonas sp.]